MAENKSTIFRKKTLDRISSPEQLTDYLRVANPGVWVILVAVILLLTGIFAWSMVGKLETTAEATVIVESHTAQVIPAGAEILSPGMSLRVSGQEFTIAAADTDDYGRMTGTAEVGLPDGTYKGMVVVDSTRPIDFLLTGR